MQAFVKHIVNKRNLAKYLFAFLLFFSSSGLNAQTTIWLEDFSLPDGTTSDAGPTAWTRDVTACSFGPGDHFDVRSNQYE